MSSDCIQWYKVKKCNMWIEHSGAWCFQCETNYYEKELHTMCHGRFKIAIGETF